MFCMKQDVPNSNCVKFDKLKCDTNNYLMQELIQKNEHLDIDANFICMKCNSYLKTGNIPVQLFTIRDINVNKCFFCEKFPKNKFRIYNKGNYKNNNFIIQIEIDINEKENIMKCHNLLLQECIVHCEICKDETERRSTLVFDKYPTLKYENIQKSRHENIYIYICKSCHVKLELKVNCVCCELEVNFHLCQKYKMENYDFNKHIVS